MIMMMMVMVMNNAKKYACLLRFLFCIIYNIHLQP
jgi:hypothetical protein